MLPGDIAAEETYFREALSLILVHLQLCFDGIAEYQLPPPL